MAQAYSLPYQYECSSMKVQARAIASPQSPAIIQHIRAYRDDKHATALQQTVRKLSQHTSPYFVPCRFIEKRERGGWFEVEFTEDYLHSLSEYKEEKKYCWMSEEEVVDSLRGILGVLHWAQLENLPHRAVTDTAIRVSGDEKRLLISWFGRKVSEIEGDIEAGELLSPCYRCPELDQLMLKSAVTRYNPYEADIYALGICIVKLAWAEPWSEDLSLYNWVDSWTEYLTVKQILLEMLKPENRPTALQLLAQLEPKRANDPYSFGTLHPAAKLQLSPMTMEFTCISVSNGKLEIENPISRRKVDLHQVKTSEGEAVNANESLQGRKVKVSMLKGGMILSVVLQSSQLEASPHQPPQNTSEFQSYYRLQQEVNRENRPIQRMLDCITCGQIYSAQAHDKTFEGNNFCSDACYLLYAETVSRIEASAPGCMLCRKSWLDIKKQNLKFISLYCSPSHLFCSLEHFRIFIEQELYVKGGNVEQLSCPMCSKLIDPRDSAMALSSLTKSMHIMRESQICLGCRVRPQELQLPCMHCFCSICVPSYPQQGPSTPCPLCPNP